MTGVIAIGVSLAALFLSYRAGETSRRAELVAKNAAQHTRDRDTRLDTKLVTVKCVPKNMTIFEETDKDGGHIYALAVEAVNEGHRPIEVTGAGFVRTEDGEHVEIHAYSVVPPVPRLIGDGDRVTFYYRRSGTEDVPSAGTFEAHRVYVRTSPDGVWFGELDEPLRLDRRWWGNSLS